MEAIFEKGMNAMKEEQARDVYAELAKELPSEEGVRRSRRRRNLAVSTGL